jgi:TP901 family phage tail tape measure protein
MALNNIGLGFTVSAKDMASRTFQQIGGAISMMEMRGTRLGRVMRPVFAGLTVGISSLVAGFGVLGGAMSLAQVAGQFEQEIGRVGALTRATAEDLGLLRDRAIQAGIATQFSPREAAQGLAELGVRGFQATESMEALGGVLDFAAGGQLSVAQGAATVGAALRAFSRDASQATFTADQLLRISNATSLQANELQIALGNVARGASSAQQSLEEMLPAIGLVRNTGVDASVAGSAVSSALTFMAGRAEQFQDRLGVSLTDAQGNFRNFLDIVLESSQEMQTRIPNAAERTATTLQLFGRFGTTAFNAIANQLREGIRNAEGQIVRGAEAIEYLRNSMQTAQGAAAEFRERMLNTFAGQVTLLKGTVQTLGVVFGEPFARVFKPIVTIVTNALNTVIRFMNMLPKEGQTAVAAVIVLAGALTTLLGVGMLLATGITLLIPMLGTLAAVMGVMAVVTAPVGLALVALAGHVAFFVLIIRRDVGQFGKFFQLQIFRVRLAFRALVQLFTQGGFSGAVRRELGQAENQGIRRFVVAVFRIGHRIKQFFVGVGEGFNEAFARLAPLVGTMWMAFMDLGRALGIVGDDADRIINGIGSQSFLDRGKAIGEVLGRSFGAIAQGLRRMARFADGVVSSFKMFYAIVAPGFQELWVQLKMAGTMIGIALKPLFDALGVSNSMDMSFKNLAITLMRYVAIAIRVVTMGLTFLVEKGVGAMLFFARMIQLLQQIKTAAITMALVVMNAVQRTVDAILNAVDTAIAGMARLAAAVPPQLRPETLSDVIVAGAAAERRVVQRTQQAETRQRMIGAAAAAVTPETAEERRVAAAVPTGFASADEMRNLMGELRRVAERPVQVNVQVDGETIASAGATAARGVAERTFRPVGVES